MLPAPAGIWPFPTLSLQIFPHVPGPVPRWALRLRPLSPAAEHRPSPSLQQIGFPTTGRTATSVRGCTFGAAVIPLRSGPWVCSPHRSLPPRPPSATGQPWLLHPSISRFVTSPCPGYASPAKAGAIDGRGLDRFTASPHQIRSLVGCSASLAALRGVGPSGPEAAAFCAASRRPPVRDADLPRRSLGPAIFFGALDRRARWRARGGHVCPRAAPSAS